MLTEIFTGAMQTVAATALLGVVALLWQGLARFAAIESGVTDMRASLRGVCRRVKRQERRLRRLENPPT